MYSTLYFYNFLIFMFYLFVFLDHFISRGKFNELRLDPQLFVGK